MYLEFLYIILGYHSSLTKKEKWFDIYIPIGMAMASIVYAVFSNSDIQYLFIKDVITFIETLLGFTLAALTLLLSNSRMEEKTRSYPTKRTIRGKHISMYELIVVFYSYLIVSETILCVFYYVASLFPTIDIGIMADVFNTIFIIGVFHVLFTTIRTVSNLYFVATGLR